MIMDFETHMPKPKRDELQLSSKGMVKKTISKSDPTKIWVKLGDDNLSLFDLDLIWYHYGLN